jgi:flagellar hook-basal body complex protein FliE
MMNIGQAIGNDSASLIKADAAALANDAGAIAHAPAGGQALPPGFSFSQSMKDALASVNQDDQVAAERMDAVDSGKSDDLVGAMLASQQANLSFSMLMQVRNKVMGAVDELLKLPV